MKTLLSKELLSEVLHGGRIIIKYLGNMENCLEYVSYCSINEMNGTKYNENLPDNYYVVKADRWQEINIYELAHKCKEWALDKGYIIEVGVHPTIKKDRSDRDYFYTVKNNRCEIQKSKHDEIIKNEVECTFKACQWIMEQTK